MEIAGADDMDGKPKGEKAGNFESISAAMISGSGRLADLTM
jgi:hypothetical protein